MSDLLGFDFFLSFFSVNLHKSVSLVMIRIGLFVWPVGCELGVTEALTLLFFGTLHCGKCQFA